MVRVMPLKLLLILIITAGNIFAQSPSRNPSETKQVSGVSVTSEIQSIEREALRQGVSPAERHAALVRLARLRQLSGDIEGAAKNWLEAAGSIPGSVDDDALLACAYCLAAMGEWERAAIALEPLVSKNIRAFFLDTGIKAIQSADTSLLAGIADNPAFSEIKHEILFLLWKISRNASAEMWRQRLVSEFPHTPEGRLAMNNGQLAMAPSPFWFFVSSLDSIPLLAENPNLRFDEQRTESREQSVVTQNSAKVQIGVFSQESNAQAQAASLRRAGFSPSIEQRGDRWAVTVPAGQDPNRTVGELKAAGFDSFLIK